MGSMYQRGRYYVYILANSDRSCVSVNSVYDLSDRMRRLRDYYPLSANFPSVPRCLVFWEMYSSAIQAVERCKELKLLSRERLRKHVTQRNPNWDDLYGSVALLDRVDHAALEELSVEE